MQVEYIPLSKDQLTEFARVVCQRMNPALDDPEIINGLGNFLHVIAVIGAKHLNGVLDDVCK